MNFYPILLLLPRKFLMSYKTKIIPEKWLILSLDAGKSHGLRPEIVRTTLWVINKHKAIWRGKQT